jgi:hypothetical protein
MSSCCNLPITRKKVMDRFGDKISYCFLDEVVTVNISSNFAILQTVKQFGTEFAAYVYVDSGMNFEDQVDSLLKGYNSLIENDYGILSIQASNDNGFEGWLGFSGFVKEKNFEIPVGKACNSHIHIFSSAMFEAFNGRLQPDIFAAYCTESTFSFFTAAIGKRWAILKDVVIDHNRGVDGASFGFNHMGHKQDPSNNLLGGLDMNVILSNPEAWESGFGYEEINSVFMHNTAVYNNFGNNKNPERLRKFLLQSMFLDKSILDYDNMKNFKYIKGNAND